MNGEQFIRLVSTFLNHTNDPRRPRRAGNRVRSRRNFRSNPDAGRGYRRYNHIQRSNPGNTYDRSPNVIPARFHDDTDHRPGHRHERSPRREGNEISGTDSPRPRRRRKSPSHLQKHSGPESPRSGTHSIILDQPGKPRNNLPANYENSTKSSKHDGNTPDPNLIQNHSDANEENSDKYHYAELNSGNENLQDTGQMEMLPLQVQHHGQTGTHGTHFQKSLDNPNDTNPPHTERLPPESLSKFPIRMEKSHTTDKSGSKKTRSTRKTPRNTIISPEIIPTPRPNITDRFQ